MHRSSTFLFQRERLLAHKLLQKLVDSTIQLLALLEFECHGALVANFGRSKVLNGAGIHEASVFCPFFAVCGKLFEGSAIQANECFFDDGFHFTVATFHVHHHGDGHTTCYPLVCGSGSVTNDCHVAGLSVCHELCSAGSKCIAVVCVIVGGSSATSFVAEEVVLCSELADELTFSFPSGEFGSGKLIWEL